MTLRSVSRNSILMAAGHWQTFLFKVTYKSGTKQARLQGADIKASATRRVVSEL